MGMKTMGIKINGNKKWNLKPQIKFRTFIAHVILKLKTHNGNENEICSNVRVVNCKNVVPNYQNIQRIYLVGGVYGKDDIPYMKWKKTNVQKTTNQIQLRVDRSCFRMPKRIIFDQKFRMVTAYLKKKWQGPRNSSGACAKGVNEYPIDFDVFPSYCINLHL